MKLLLTILLFPFLAYGQQVTFTPTQTSPTATNDPFRPGCGLNNYNGLTPVINWPNPAVNARGPDLYIRIQWGSIQNGSSSASFDWSDFDSKMNNCIDRNQKAIIGFSSVDDSYSGHSDAGKTYAYPPFVHTQMQGEANPDWVPSGSSQWVPNWNSTNYLNAWDAWNVALRTHMNSTSHSGKTYIQALYGVDIRGFGNYGEWHLFGAGHGVTPPTGTAATDASLERIVQAHYITGAFPDFPLFLNINMLNGSNSSSDVSTAFGYWALTHSNSWGPFGLRWDHVCDLNTFNYDYTNNTTNLNGLTFKTAIANIYKSAPVVGEPQQFNFAAAGQCDYYHVPTEAQTYHASMIENANNIENGGAVPTCTADIWRATAAAMGYRYTILNGQMDDSLRRGGNFHIQWNGNNIGNAPTYEQWTSTYEFRQAGTVKFSYTSTFKPFLLLPGAFTIIDNQILPSTLSGTYDLYIIVRDPNSYRTPMPLQISGRGADGAYLLRSGIPIATAGGITPPPPPPPPNNPPNVFAGSDQTDTLPKNIDTLQGIVSDPNGDALTLSWTQLSGPNTATMVSPTAILNRITGLIEGTYVFRLTANDGKGGITSDDVTVFVFNVTTPPPPPPPPPTYSPPTITAGNDTIIQLPADSAILRGHVTHKDTLIQSALWSKFSGTGGTIVTPNDSTTRVTGLTAGFYQYRFRITDKAGNIVDDYMTVQVLPVIPVPPPPLPAIAQPTKVFGIKSN